ncbi:DUF6802 family protein [Nocardia sp. NPDC057353]|uniref:DUF6802 family protein n=1 Tax=Nocardia sp. NPDC057353 TaxID=3346104 RepID=UPI0036386331
MVNSPEFPGIDLPDVDAASPLHDLGEVGLAHPVQDIDGDGALDSITESDEHGMRVWTDTDRDGLADHLTVVEKDGDYAAWEFHHHPDGTSEWVRTDQGRLG